MAEGGGTGRVGLAMRALGVGGRILAAAALTLPTAAVLALRLGRPAARRYLCRRTVATVVRLGPTFIKAGQILGTRRDVVPAMLCDELSALRDDVPPLDPHDSRRALAAVYGDDLGTCFADVDYVAVAGGSVACVYRAILHDGSVVALKLRRPGVDVTMRADVKLMRRMGELVARLPALRGVPVLDILDSLAGCVLGQLDFVAEATSLDRIRRNLATQPRVRVPRVRAEQTRPACIVMDFIDGLDTRTSRDCSPVLRRGFASSTLNLMYQMLFLDGFVHCDLHPGNLYYLPGGQVVVLDAGFSAQLSDQMRRLFADFFLNMSIGRGRRCAELVVESAEGVRDDADVAGFLAAMAELVERNHSAPAKDFSLIDFATEMFLLQRGYGIAAAPELVFPLLALLVIEGTVRDLDPEVDFQAVARPVVTKAVFARQQRVTASA